MHRKFMEEYSLSLQDLDNALKKERRCGLKPSVTQSICEWEKITAELCCTTCFVVVFHLREIALFKAEEKDWGDWFYEL